MQLTQDALRERLEQVAARTMPNVRGWVELRLLDSVKAAVDAVIDEAAAVMGELDPDAVLIPEPATDPRRERLQAAAKEDEANAPTVIDEALAMMDEQEADHAEALTICYMQGQQASADRDELKEKAE